MCATYLIMLFKPIIVANPILRMSGTLTTTAFEFCLLACSLLLLALINKSLLT